MDWKAGEGFQEGEDRRNGNIKHGKEDNIPERKTCEQRHSGGQGQLEVAPRILSAWHI